MSKTTMIILIIVAIVVVVILTLLSIYLIHKKKIRDSNRQADEKVQTSAIEVSDKFGGRNNIEQISSKGSRVTVLVKDPTIVDKEGINMILEQVMFMGNKVVFVIGSKSEYFKELLEENVDKNID